MKKRKQREKGVDEALGLYLDYIEVCNKLYSNVIFIEGLRVMNEKH